VEAKVRFVENRHSHPDILKVLRVTRRIITLASHRSPRVGVPSAPLRLVVVALFFAGIAFAHPSEVLGTLRSDPATPVPGVPFRLQLTLADADQTPIETARVQAEFRRNNVPQNAAAIRTDFKLSSTPGTYQTTLRLPEAGPWTVQLRERTFTHEDAVVEVGFSVSPVRNPTKWEVTFAPPAPPSLRSWLLWVVVVPLLAGAVVTASVFGRSRETRPA
jgi:hypothetical protein